MIVVHEISDIPVKASFVKYDDVFQGLAANSSDDPFHVRTLPRRARCGQDLLDHHGLDLVDEFFPEDSIAIPQKIAGRSVPRKGLAGVAGHSIPMWDAR